MASSFEFNLKVTVKKWCSSGQLWYYSQVTRIGPGSIFGTIFRVLTTQKLNTYTEMIFSGFVKNFGKNCG